MGLGAREKCAKLHLDSADRCVATRTTTSDLVSAPEQVLRGSGLAASSWSNGAAPTFGPAARATTGLGTMRGCLLEQFACPFRRSGDARPVATQPRVAHCKQTRRALTCCAMSCRRQTLSMHSLDFLRASMICGVQYCCYRSFAPC